MVSKLAAHLSNFCLTTCHMLVSKIKLRMSQRKPHEGEAASGSLNQLWFLRWWAVTWNIHSVNDMGYSQDGATIAVL